MSLSCSCDICRKWYKKLGFPIEYDSEFEKALCEYRISDEITIENYNLNESDGRKNLLSFLFMCESVERKYREMGIDEKILVDTLSDIVIWTKIWTEVKGELHLGELEWLKSHMKAELFRIGSLEYRAAKSEFPCLELGLEKGDNIVEIHIPNGADISESGVSESLSLAKEFFGKYFSEYCFSHFTFHSWMMDKELSRLLKPESNILKFQRLFVRVESETTEDYAGLRYAFKWNTTKMNLSSQKSRSSFAENMKNHVLSGGKLYLCAGVMMK